MLGHLRLWQGDWEAAARWLESALVPATAMEDRQALEETHVCLSELEVLSGTPDLAVVRLEPLAISKAPVARSFRPTWPGRIWSEGRWNVLGSLSDEQ